MQWGVSPTDWYLPSIFTRIKLWAAAAALSTPPESSGEDQQWRTLYSGKTWQNRFQIIRYFRFYEPNSCIPLYLEKHPSPSWWRLLIVTSSDLPKTSSNMLWNICAWLHVIPLHQSHVYILTFPHSSLEHYLSAIWNVVSRAIVLILLQIKLNSPLSYFAFFFSWQESAKELDKAKMVENCLQGSLDIVSKCCEDAVSKSEFFPNFFFLMGASLQHGFYW